MSIGRKGMELTATMLVTIIIAIMIFGTGFFLLGKIYSGSQDIAENLDQTTEKQLRDQLASGALVAIPENTKEVRSRQNAHYWIGIRNLVGTTEQFVVRITFSRAFDESERVIPGTDAAYISDRWLFAGGTDGPFEIRNNEHIFRDVLVKPSGEIAAGVSAPKGTYFFNVCVYPLDNAALAPACDDSQLQSPDLYPQGKISKLVVNLV